MTTMYVTYSGDAATRFDRDYYIQHHLPLVMECWGPLGLEGCAAFWPAVHRRGNDLHLRMPVPRRSGDAGRASLAHNAARDGGRRSLHRRDARAGSCGADLTKATSIALTGTFRCPFRNHWLASR